jgi:glycosyltransferase involved in cell wall biosynthesis
VSTPFLSLIIPAHNESERLPASLEAVKRYISSLPFETEVIVVENNSSDATAEITREWMNTMPQLRLISLAQPGKGNAIRTGMLAAQGAFRFMADADFSMPVEEIGKFLPDGKPLASVVIASREAAGSKRIGEPFYRHIIGRVYNLLVRLLVLPGLQDTQCGFKCFSAEAAQAIFPLQRLEGWSFDVEVLTIARQLGFEIAEVPITWHYQPGSRMHLLQDSLQMAKDLFTIRQQRKKGLYHAPKV